MSTLFVRHQVKAFDAWKKVYDAFNAERMQLGVTGHGIYQDVDNPNDVTVYHEFKNFDEAKAFFGNTRVREVMANAGVVGEPTAWFTQKA